MLLFKFLRKLVIKKGDGKSTQQTVSPRVLPLPTPSRKPKKPYAGSEIRPFPPPTSDIPLCTELIELIFEHLDKTSITVVSSVCKKWHRIGLELFWRRLESQQDIRRLLKLLSPSLPKGNDNITLKEIPRSADWARLLHCSPFVHSITYADYYPYKSVFQHVASMRPSGFILFPNLKVVNYKVSSNETHCFLFMQPSIKCFTLEIANIVDPALLIDGIIRMPNLTYLEIVSHRSDLSGLANAIVELSSLRVISLPVYFLTWRMLEILADRSHLEEIKCSSPLPASFAPSKPVLQPFLPSNFPFKGSAFVVLEKLTLATAIDPFLNHLDERSFFRRLSTLHLILTQPEPPSQIQLLLTTVSQYLAALKDFSLEDLNYLVSKIKGKTGTNYANCRMSFDNLEPILSLRGLTSLRFRFKFPLSESWTNRQVEVLSLALPNIETLALNENPYVVLPESHPPLTLDILRHFARNCLNLQHLGIYVSGYMGITNENGAFDALRTLDVGHSSVQDKAHIAVFLAQVLTPKCNIVHARKSTNEAEEYDAVVTMIGPLRHMCLVKRASMEQRIDELQAELEKFRMMTGLD